jgi:hypothetical protein
VHRGVGGVGRVGGERQPTGGQAFRQELRQPGLEERRFAARQGRHVVGHDVDAYDVMAQACHAGRMDGTEVAAPEH